MPKKRLSELAKEYGITFEEIHKIATYHLDEHMITGNGKNLWTVSYTHLTLPTTPYV